jgi:hypothetical protein
MKWLMRRLKEYSAKSSMNVNRSGALCFTFVFLASMASGAHTIEGNWESKPYSIQFWPTDVEGSWGDTKYKINFWSDDIEGAIAGKKMEIRFWESEIEGDLPCGPFRIMMKDVRLFGTICGEQFDHPTLEGVKKHDMAFEMATELLLPYFPVPAHSSLRLLIEQGRKKYGWMKKLDEK